MLVRAAARRLLSTSVAVGVRLPEGTELSVRARAGATLLEALQSADLSDVWEGGACGGACACSTCRVVVLDAPTALAPRSVEEEDMLETAGTAAEKQGGADAERFLEPSSRLACQITLRAPQDQGLHVLLPEDVVNVLEVPLWLRGQR